MLKITKTTKICDISLISWGPYQIIINDPYIEEMYGSNEVIMHFSDLSDEIQSVWWENQDEQKFLSFLEHECEIEFEFTFDNNGEEIGLIIRIVRKESK